MGNNGATALAAGPKSGRRKRVVRAHAIALAFGMTHSDYHMIAITN